MFEYENTDDELLEEDTVDDSVPDDLPEPVAEAEDAVANDSKGVVWVRGKNGKLERS
jgi:hypothetical protein